MARTKTYIAGEWDGENAASINRSKCPDILKNIGIHKEMKSFSYVWNTYRYDYAKVRNAIEG